MKIILPVSDAAQSRNRVPMGRSATAPGTWGAHQASQLGADTPAGSTGCGGGSPASAGDVRLLPAERGRAGWGTGVPAASKSSSGGQSYGPPLRTFCPDVLQPTSSDHPLRANYSTSRFP